MDLIVCEALLDSLNQAKIAYKDGLTGTIILGDRYQKIFTALPEHFTLTDFDIHITASTEVIQELESLKAIIPELIKSQLLTPDIIFEAMTAKSLTDLKYKVQKAMKIQKEENNQLQQLSQQLEELQKQNQQLQQELQKSQILMIGDASGKPGDFSDSDKKCAENFGIDYIDVRDFLEL